MMTMLRNCLTDIVLQVLFRGNKYSAFEGGTAVPAIVSWPKEIPGSQISDALVSQIDWFASMAALINAKLPKGSAPDSQNRLNTWLGKDQTDRPWIIEESSTMSVRTKNWKYIEPNDGPAMITWGPKVETGNLKTPQLYDMRVREYEKGKPCGPTPRNSLRNAEYSETS